LNIACLFWSNFQAKSRFVFSIIKKCYFLAASQSNKEKCGVAKFSTMRNCEVYEVEVTFDEFKKIDLRVGKIVEAEQIAGSKKLLKILVDFGSDKRQAVAGLLQWYQPSELVGKKAVFLLNLQRRVMLGVESQCMILAAEDDQGNVTVLQPEKDIAEGSKVG
jgi:methionine--tRNA ligase beta chain